MQLYDFQNNNDYIEFIEHMEKGHTFKELVFNIYDDNIRLATLTLFRIMQNIDNDKFEEFNNWLLKNINTDMLHYARRLTVLYSDKLGHLTQRPPFIENPMYFTNAETIAKANRLQQNDGRFSAIDAEINQFAKIDDIISINTNYSGWNLINNGVDKSLNYFREDIGLNSYYLGLHLLHPFWMSNEKMDEVNPRHAEHFVFFHHQLLARYFLEKQHLKYECNNETEKEKIERYDPYLRYRNGLAFPVRYEYCYKKNNNKEWTRIMETHISMTECISRGFIVMVSNYI